MDFLQIGSINNYTKTSNMQAQWNLKNKSGNTASHTSPLSEYVKNSAQSAEESDSDKKLSFILQKTICGQKLSEDELKYIQTKDPLSYQKICSIQQEQKSYEQELKKCKTKEDVQRLKMSRIISSLSTLKSIENNPHITQEKKLRLINLEKMRCDKLEQTTHNFVKSGEYEQLPTEAEQAKAYREIEKAETAHKFSIETTIKQESPEIRKIRRLKAKAAYTSIQKFADTESSLALDV